MSSIRRIISSRANGALSRGPKTQAGKLKSAQNALHHGICAQKVVLPHESQADFDRLVRQHVARFLPQNAPECRLIAAMAAARWRLRRLWAAETRLMDRAMPAENDTITRISAAFLTLLDNGKLNRILVYEARQNRIYQNCLHNLLVSKDLQYCLDIVQPEAIHAGPKNATQNSKNVNSQERTHLMKSLRANASSALSDQ